MFSIQILAKNYNPQSNINDNTCYPIIEGCLDDIDAFNFIRLIGGLPITQVIVRSSSCISNPLDIVVQLHLCKQCVVLLAHHPKEDIQILQLIHYSQN